MKHMLGQLGREWVTAGYKEQSNRRPDLRVGLRQQGTIGLVTGSNKRSADPLTNYDYER